MIELRPVTQSEAFAFVHEHHRHHTVPVGALWWHGVHDDEGQLAGVAIVGRPVSRRLDDRLTCEVTRLCTLGTDNACTMLYGAARRCAEAKGYCRGLTYILDQEFQATRGASLRAAGWFYLGLTKDETKRGWDRSARPRPNNTPAGRKHKFGWGAWAAEEIVALEAA